MAGTAMLPFVSAPAARRWLALGDEVLCAAGGLAFTFGLFWVIAHFERVEPAPPVDDFADLRTYSSPMEAPPPRVVEAVAAPAEATPLAGLELGSSESPVKLAVVPPELSAFMPAPETAPAAIVPRSQLLSVAKPRLSVETDYQRIFQQSEVDQKPTVRSRPNPKIPSWIRGNAQTLRIMLLLIVDTEGAVTSVRVLTGSGNPGFDKIIVRAAREDWVFNAATKNGKRVRCMVQQSVRVTWQGGTPFES